MIVRFILNRNAVEIETSPDRRLLDVLREDLSLTGTKEGCSIGECGACTVVMNGRAVNACLILIGQVEGAEILTIEGVAQEDLHPLQRNFMRCGAIQCGFCTPGMVLAAYALLSETPQPTDHEVATALAGNLCRCTGYKQIIEAIRETANELKSR